MLTLGALGVGLGAVYGGFHYSVDMAAGAVVGGLSAWVALRIDRAGPTGA